MDAHFCQAFKRWWVEGKDCSHTSGFWWGYRLYPWWNRL